MEDRLKAELKAVRKSFLRREVVDFRWEGKELAKTLNSDASLKNLLYPADRLALLNKGLIRLSSVEINIVPYRKHQCIRMSQKGGTFHPPADAFPTVETFDAFDRIAQHIRSVANVHP